MIWGVISIQVDRQYAQKTHQKKHRWKFRIQYGDFFVFARYKRYFLSKIRMNEKWCEFFTTSPSNTNCSLFDAFCWCWGLLWSKAFFRFLLCNFASSHRLGIKYWKQICINNLFGAACALKLEFLWLAYSGEMIKKSWAFTWTTKYNISNPYVTKIYFWLIF